MSPSDVIGAAGMAAQEHEAAMLLWGVCYGGKTGEKLALVEVLSVKLTAYMLRERIKGDPRRISMEVLAYYLLATCQHCQGTGYQIIPGTITRYDDPCPQCQGTGKPQAPAHPGFAWLLHQVEMLISKAAGKVMDKIDLNLG